MTHVATISKTFDFSSAHHLRGLPEEHPCSREHGHNYVVRLTITGKTDPVGFVIDYRRFQWFKDYLDATFDHQDLNRVIEFNPTAENLASHFAETAFAVLREEDPDFIQDRFVSLAVAVSETPKTWAEVTIRNQCDLPVTEEELDRDRYRWGHR